MIKAYPVDPRDRYTGDLLWSVDNAIRAGEDIVEYQIYDTDPKRYRYKGTISDPFAVADLMIDYWWVRKKVKGANWWYMARILNGEIE